MIAAAASADNSSKSNDFAVKEVAELAVTEAVVDKSGNVIEVASGKVTEVAVIPVRAVKSTEAPPMECVPAPIEVKLSRFTSELAPLVSIEMVPETVVKPPRLASLTSVVVMLVIEERPSAFRIVFDPVIVIEPAPPLTDEAK